MKITEKFLKDDIVDDMIWSFSRLNGFYTCKRMWYLTYISKSDRSIGFFTQYGLFGHEIFEKYGRGELKLEEIMPFIKDKYSDFVNIQAPPNPYVDLGESYSNKMISSFENFKGFDDETLDIEKEISFELDFFGIKKPFIGYIDRVSRDNKGIVITDYKSKTKFASKKELKEYARQPYLYSEDIKNKYGEFPYKLCFDMFKSQNKVEIPFNMEDFEEAKQWARDTIQKIYDEVEFPCNVSQFFCDYICGVKEACDYMENQGE